MLFIMIALVSYVVPGLAQSLKWTSVCLGSAMNIECNTNRVVIYESMFGLIVNSSSSLPGFTLDTPPEDVIQKGLSCYNNTELVQTNNCGFNVHRNVSRMCSGRTSCQRKIIYSHDFPKPGIDHCYFKNHLDPILYVQYRCVPETYFHAQNDIGPNGFIIHPHYFPEYSRLPYYSVNQLPTSTEFYINFVNPNTLQFRVLDLDLYGSQIGNEECDFDGQYDKVEVYGKKLDDSQEDQLVTFCGNNQYNDSIFNIITTKKMYEVLLIKFKFSKEKRIEVKKGILLEYIGISCEDTKFPVGSNVTYLFNSVNSALSYENSKSSTLANINCGPSRLIVTDAILSRIINTSQFNSLDQYVNQSTQLICDPTTSQWLPAEYRNLKCLTVSEMKELIITTTTTSPPETTVLSERKANDLVNKSFSPTDLSSITDSSFIMNKTTIGTNFTNSSSSFNSELTTSTATVNNVESTAKYSSLTVFAIYFASVFGVLLILSVLVCWLYRYFSHRTHRSTSKSRIAFYTTFNNNLSDISSQVGNETPLLYKPNSFFTLPSIPRSVCHSSGIASSATTLKTNLPCDVEDPRICDFALPRKAPRQPNRLSQFLARPVSGLMSGSATLSRRMETGGPPGDRSIGGSSLRMSGCNYIPADVSIAPSSRQLSLDGLGREDPYLEPCKSATVLRRTAKPSRSDSKYNCYDITQSPRHSLDFGIADWNMEGNRQSLGGMLSNHYYEHRESVYESLDANENDSVEPLPRSRYPLPPCPVEDEEEPGYQPLDPPKGISTPNLLSA